ncbi:TPA: BRO-like protein [Streptococcus suis]|nr:BRO-like protein [Streptococcus suis]
MRRNYSKVIEEMRSTHGLNFVTIAKRIGTDPRTVGKWAQGKHQPNKDSRKKINNLYREVKQNMTTQVSIFDETTGQIMQVVATADFHGQPLDIYGDTQSPWFRAKDVASMIDYSIASMNKFLQSVDEDEKEQKNIPTPGGIQKTWFLTEQGLYEVLFQSRKPIAKEFKKLIKNILKEIRVNGYYMQGELIQDQPTQPAIELNSDMAYIKNRLSELQSMTTMADIKVGLAKTYRIAELMED